jgi:hypothetical protein
VASLTKSPVEHQTSTRTDEVIVSITVRSSNLGHGKLKYSFTNQKPSFVDGQRSSDDQQFSDTCVPAAIGAQSLAIVIAGAGFEHANQWRQCLWQTGVSDFPTLPWGLQCAPHHQCMETGAGIIGEFRDRAVPRVEP